MDWGINILFLVIAASVIVMTIVLITLLVYVLRIVRDIKKLTGKVRKEGEEIVDGVHTLRKAVEKPFVDIASFIGVTNKSKKHAKKDK